MPRAIVPVVARSGSVTRPALQARRETTKRTDSMIRPALRHDVAPVLIPPSVRLGDAPRARVAAGRGPPRVIAPVLIVIQQ
ncbi:MAG: hypothetical protein ACREFY_19745 [Acetobacteraceae bacterium]